MISLALRAMADKFDQLEGSASQDELLRAIKETGIIESLGEIKDGLTALLSDEGRDPDFEQIEESLRKF